MKNDPAFPLSLNVFGPGKDSSRGLTKREYFAALAMQNLQNVLLRKSGTEGMLGFCRTFNLPETDKGFHGVIAKLAVMQADALIKELENAE